MPALDDFAKAQLEALARQNRLRRLPEAIRSDALHLVKEGRSLINFGSNDYLGLSQHPAVLAALAQAAPAVAGSGASRFLGGNDPAYGRIESRLADLKGREAALLMGNGYLACMGALATLVGRGDLVVADKLIHACLIDGVSLSGAKLVRFGHNDMDGCTRLLKTHRAAYGKCIILTETIFGMDGDAAPLGELRQIADRHDAWLVADDAHGFGVLPAAATDALDVVIGTLSKGAGVYGGYLAGSRLLTDWLRQAIRPSIFSTALPPILLTATEAALAEIQPGQGSAAQEHARRFAQVMELPAPDAAIVPVPVGDASRALALSSRLEEAGYYVPAIRPPTVPEGTARLRVSFSALHTPEMVDGLIEAVKHNA